VREREDIDHSTRGDALLEILHRIDETQRGGRIIRVEIGGNDRTRPAADA